MSPAREQLRWLGPFLIGGLLATLFVAWALPLLAVTRGEGLGEERMRTWFAAGPARSESAEPHRLPALELQRSALTERYSAVPTEDGYWPVGPLLEYRDETSLVPAKRTPPAAVVVVPPDGELGAWSRIDTLLVGWPFRAFSGEAWFRTLQNRDSPDVVAEARGAWSLGLMQDDFVFVPLRPRWLGILGNIVFWGSVAWAAVALPLAIRRHRREKYGKCAKCGYTMDRHAVKRPDRCPECGTAFARDPLGFARSPEMHFQNTYVWVIFISSLDIMLTWKILSRGGIEVNPVAAIVIDAWGMHGAIAFKFALMMWVIVACEILARLRRSAGRFLATAAVVISATPVVWSLFLLVLTEFFPE